ncbi:hypothetical protein GT354_29200, partial [Streptomyces sp. SID3343]|nr:hypothetical protein [Streptomyces sp. SID3343]
AWSTVYDRFRQWRDAGVLTALMDATITEAARRGPVDMSLVGVDSTVVRAHRDAAGVRVGEGVLAALEEAAGRTMGDREKREQGKPPGATTIPTAPNGAGSDVDAERG